MFEANAIADKNEGLWEEIQLDKVHNDEKWRTVERQAESQPTIVSSIKDLKKLLASN